MDGSSPRLCGLPMQYMAFCPIILTITSKLYVVMFNILDQCYHQNLGFEPSLATENAIPQILEGERQLEEWRFRVVPSLGIKLWHEPLLADSLAQMDPASTISHRFGIVLSVRYHNLRILLYRKFLEYFLDSHDSSETLPGGSTLIQQMGFNGIRNCIESAESIISTVNTITLAGGWHRGLLGAWNYTLYYSMCDKELYAPSIRAYIQLSAFNAGLVIFGALFVFSKTPSQSPEQWRIVCEARPYLDIAAEALRRLDSGNQVIERCVEYLSQLSLMLKSAGKLPSSLSYYLMQVKAYEFPIDLAEPLATRSFASPQPKIYTPDTALLHDDSHVMWPDVDLGEFMMDNDLDFLGRMFNSSHGPNTGV